MTQLSYEDQLQRAKQFILERDRFLVVSHLNPDGDAISSTCTVGRILTELGKEFTMANEESVPDKFTFLWGADRIHDVSASSNAQPEMFRNIISVDCADASRMGETRRWFHENAALLNIDHHPTNNFFGTSHLIKEDAAATAEILYDLVETFGLTWHPTLAQCVYTGLLTDTGGFRYANTSPKVMKIASRLLEFGVDANKMAETLLEKTTPAQVQLLKKALNSLDFSENRKIAWVVVRAQDIQEAGANNGDTEGIVNVPRNIEGVAVGIFFKQVSDDEVRISMRSDGTVDVSQIASGLGGGGHVRAAGASLKGELDQIISTVIQNIDNVLND